MLLLLTAWIVNCTIVIAFGVELPHQGKEVKRFVWKIYSTTVWPFISTLGNLSFRLGLVGMSVLLWNPDSWSWAPGFPSMVMRAIHRPVSRYHHVYGIQEMEAIAQHS